MSTAPPAWLRRPSPPYLNWDRRSPITVLCSVLSLWRFAVSHTRLSSTLCSFHLHKQVFLLSRPQCWYFLCDVQIPPMAVCRLLWGVIGKHCSTIVQVLFCVFSPKAAIYFLFKRRIVCLFFSDRTVKELCIFVLNCNLCFKMLTGYLSHDLMSLW